MRFCIRRENWKSSQMAEALEFLADNDMLTMRTRRTTFAGNQQQNWDQAARNAEAAPATNMDLCQMPAKAAANSRAKAVNDCASCAFQRRLVSL
jgi:hypothetical protein